jgi:HemK-related putative methylase
VYGTTRSAHFEVYPLREDSRFLARFARPRRGEIVLEIGCGRGLAALVSARHGARKVVATDLNPAALGSVYRRARDEDLPIEAVRTDLAAGLRRFDLILSNPPYLPTAHRKRDEDPWENLAVDGGPDGCEVTARIVAALPGHLTTTGRAYILVSSLQSHIRLGTLRQHWRARWGECRSVAREQWGEETLSVWKFSRSPRRTGRSIPGTDGRPPVPPVDRFASSRDAGSDRTNAQDGA